MDVTNQDGVRELRIVQVAATSAVHTDVITLNVDSVLLISLYC